MSVDEFVIARDVLDAIRRQADAAPGGDWEVGGEIRVERGRLVEYRRRENLAAGPAFYEPERLPPRGWVMLHTHPGVGCSCVSDGDLAFARQHKLPALAIFSPDHDKLRLWGVDESRVREIPVRVEQRRPGPRLPLRRPGRR